MAVKTPAVGIDLGTTYSWWVLNILQMYAILKLTHISLPSVGVFQHGKVEIIANDQVIPCCA